MWGIIKEAALSARLGAGPLLLCVNLKTISTFYKERKLGIIFSSGTKYIHEVIMILVIHIESYIYIQTWTKLWVLFR